MDSTLAVVPQISISLAPPEAPVIEPYSPFSATISTPLDDNAFRPVLLTPPPSLTRFGKPLSPLRPCEETVAAKGLERERFEALLQASRERNVAFGAKKAGDLRKEIALKAHKNKQVERRALFLSKVLAPPSPTATLTPKTPPDSPAIFHYSLPSPGLVSPLALFESLSEDLMPGSYGREPWVEQVDFRLPEYTKARDPGAQTSGPHTGRPLPSLDQISARLSSQGHTRLGGDEAGHRSRTSVPRQTAVSDRPRLYLGVGRLQMPIRAHKPTLEPLVIEPPKSPMAPRSPNLQITTLVVPPSSTTSPTELSESNLYALHSRERRAHNMLSTLRRRTIVPETDDGIDGRNMKWKRHSAPADLLPLRQRSGFEHPVLALPGGF